MTPRPLPPEQIQPLSTNVGIQEGHGGAHDEKPTPAWQKWVALAVLLAVVACVVVFRRRLGGDFLPLDASRVGPNIIASALTWAVLFTATVLLWPPWRRRLHRFVDGKLSPLHARVAELHGRHDDHSEHLDKLGRSLADLHEKLDALHEEPPRK